MVVYVHYPQCDVRCGYCDFPTVALADFPHARYADQVLRELQGRAPAYAGRRVRAVYFGGGTPSLWPGQEVARVLAALRGAFAGSEGWEVTLEANPGQLPEAQLAALLDAGVNRLSLGVQSLDDAVLRLLTRSHTARLVEETVTRARRLGLANLTCDAIFGHAGQTLEHHLDQLDRLVSLGPDHVSLYGLTLSSGAALRRAGVTPLEPDAMGELLEAGCARLEELGYPQYEVSNYAPAPFRSRHHGLVWSGHPYLGLGASAHSLWTGPSDAEGAEGLETIRCINPPFSRYLDVPVRDGRLPALAGSRIEIVEPGSARYEMLFVALRTTDGLSRPLYRTRFGADVTVHYGGALAELAEVGLLCVEPDRVRPTRRGLWLADEVALRL